MEAWGHWCPTSDRDREYVERGYSGNLAWHARRMLLDVDMADTVQGASGQLSLQWI